MFLQKKGESSGIKLNKSWFIFYGLKLGMSKQETMNCPYGLFMDLLTCLSIYEGNMKPKRLPMSMDEFLKLN